MFSRSFDGKERQCSMLIVVIRDRYVWSWQCTFHFLFTSQTLLLAHVSSLLPRISRPFWQPFSLTEPLRDAVGSPWGMARVGQRCVDAKCHRILNQGPVCLSSQRCTSALVLVTRDNPVDEVPVNLANSGMIGWTKNKNNMKKEACRNGLEIFTDKFYH